MTKNDLANFLDDHLAPGWKKMYKAFTTIAVVAFYALAFLEKNFTELQPYLPEKWVMYFPAIFLVVRWIKQNLYRVKNDAQQ